MFTKKNDKEKTLVSNLKYLIGKEDKLKEKLEDNSYLEPFSDDLMLFMGLIKDYYKGDYRKIPFRTISAGVIGAIYTLNPIDLIPDSIPFIGYIDDALVLKFCLKQAQKDLQKYKVWKQEQADAESKPVDEKDTDNISNDKTSTDEEDDNKTSTDLKKAS
jgi:uncharacterized membrane protein YkvA (DUF1232 family)